VEFIHLVQDQESWRKGQSATEMQTFFVRRHCFLCPSRNLYPISPPGAETPTVKTYKTLGKHTCKTQLTAWQYLLEGYFTILPKDLKCSCKVMALTLNISYTSNNLLVQLSSCRYFVLLGIWCWKFVISWSVGYYNFSLYLRAIFKYNIYCII
jgi:hypothetical protein